MWEDKLSIKLGIESFIWNYAANTENDLIHLPADHSSISSRHKTGPPEGTKDPTALLRS
jgi:hypothetical protein